MISYGVVAHGGAGSPPQFSDGCRKACEAAFSLLETGKSSLEAVVEAARNLENDGRFNAGSGSALRLDGKTIEMDASVMDSGGNIGIVMAIRNVRNPVLVARAVVNTPHVALAGEGATVFAMKQGFERFYRIQPHAIDRHNMVKEMIRHGTLHRDAPRWKGHDVESLWNFENISYKDVFCDTVGAVAVDKEGVFASASSTGGFSPMMLGRVGDSPMVGCGFYAGPVCAVAVTGMGEEIIRRMLSRTLYDMVSDGKTVDKACRSCMNLFPPETKAGIVAITREGYGIASNIQMATHAIVKMSG